MRDTRSPVMNAQQRGVRFTVTAAILFSALLLVGFVYTQSRPKHLSPEELQSYHTWLFEQPRELSTFELLDHDEQAFRHDNLQGHWSLVFFGFTYCPDVCPATLAQLTQFHEQLPAEVAADTRIYLVTVDPARDTPEQLRQYVTYFHPDFKGITGEFMSVYQFATELSSPFVKVPGGGDAYQVEHSANIALINPRGHFVGFFRPPHDISRMSVAYQSVRAQR